MPPGTGVSGQAENVERLPDSEFLPPVAMNLVENHVKARIERQLPGSKQTIGLMPVAIVRESRNRAETGNAGLCPTGCA